ncbi:MAG: N-acetylmuramoyl-L-alanine amidase [Smithellaceae bacterium]
MLCKTKKVLLISGLLLISFIISGMLDLSAAEKKHLVVIDPAHGGQDTGVKITDKVGEKDITLAIALGLQKELAKEGNFEIVLTRDSDKLISIEDRRKEISKIKPDVFLSLHINGGFGKAATGFEIYYPGFRDITDQKKQVKDGQKDAKSKYLNDSVRLAQIIQKKLDSLFPRKGRGLREADTPVLEEMNVPAVVVEIGFATNLEERKKLLSANTQSEIAKTLAKGIILFFR